MADKWSQKRIENTLRAEIMDGTLVGRLPRSEDFAERFGVAMSTVTSALNELKREGLVETTRGQGAARHAVDFAAHVVSAQAYIEPTGSLKYDPPQVGEVTPPGDVARTLGADRAVVRRRLTRLDGEPIELSESYLPVELARELGLDRPRRPKGGIKAVLAEAGMPQRKGVDVVSARLPTEEEVQALGLPSSVPVLRIRRTITADDGRVLCVDVIVKGAHRYHEQYEFEIV